MKGVELPDGRVWGQSSVFDYVSVSTIPGNVDTSPLFVTWTAPLVCGDGLAHDRTGRMAAISRVGDRGLMPVQGWDWLITAVAASNAEIVVQLEIGGIDYTFSGPWLAEGVTLTRPILVQATLLLSGEIDRRRCATKGAVQVWLKGLLHRSQG